MQKFLSFSFFFFHLVCPSDVSGHQGCVCLCVCVIAVSAPKGVLVDLYRPVDIWWSFVFVLVASQLVSRWNT